MFALGNLKIFIYFCQIITKKSRYEMDDIYFHHVIRKQY
jgi:hypothetical protein